MPVDYHAWTHRPKALGGTDPLEVAGTSAALLHELDVSGGASITADTWTRITPASGIRFFGEGWQSDSDWTVSHDGAIDGNFARQEFALYEAWASVEFGNSLNDELIGVSIQWAASSDFIYPNVIPVKSAQKRVSVTSHHWATLSTPVRFYCYTSVTRNLRQAELFIRRHELNDSGEILSFP